MAKDSGTIVVEQEYAAPVSVVWRAITDRDQMRLWFFSEMRDFKPVVGFETQFTVEFKGQEFIHRWRVSV
ncbi:MAG TPA: SRPBCC domain-containing protein [Firmicutes bacterium]|nr:SRPBCC domain-containing protein [Candidatus Fermentithermobacillaceae bacterium]